MTCPMVGVHATLRFAAPYITRPVITTYTCNTVGRRTNVEQTLCESQFWNCKLNLTPIPVFVQAITLYPSDCIFYVPSVRPSHATMCVEDQSQGSKR